MKEYKLFNETTIKRLRKFNIVFFIMIAALLCTALILRTLNNSLGEFLTNNFFWVCLVLIFVSYVATTVWTMTGKNETKFFTIIDGELVIKKASGNVKFPIVGLSFLEVDYIKCQPAVSFLFVYNEQMEFEILLHRMFVTEILQVLKEYKVNILDNKAE